jgi:hypothetical protein
MTRYLVIAYNDVNDSYVVEDLSVFINKMYELDFLDGKSFEDVNRIFYNDYRVFEIEGWVKDLN